MHKFLWSLVVVFLATTAHAQNALVTGTDGKLYVAPNLDNDPTNELNTEFTFDFSSGDLTITDAGGSLVQNLNGLKSDPITFCNPATGEQVPLRTATMPALNSRESNIVVGTGTGVTLSDGTGLEAIVEGGGYTEIFRIPGTELTNPNQCRTMRYICGYRGAAPRMQTDNDRFNLRITGLGNGVPTITFDTSSTLSSDPVSADDFEWDGGWPITQFSVHVVPPGGTVTLPDIVYELERELGEPDGLGFETFLGEQGVAPFCLGAAT